MTGRAPGEVQAVGAHHVCLVVPHGTARPEPIAEALRRVDPGVSIAAVWCGDPQLRPVTTLPWLDTTAATSSSDWHHVLVSRSAIDAEWLAALSAARSILQQGAATVTTMWVGSVAVLDDVSALWTDCSVMRVVPRLLGPLPDDAATPDDLDLVASGLFSDRVATFGAGGLGAIEWLERQIVTGDDVCVGRWLELAVALFGGDVCDDERMGVGRWRWSTERPCLLDAPALDATAPWSLQPDERRRARVAIVGHADRTQALADAAEQLAGERRPLSAPGGLLVDDTIRTMARHADAASVPSAWTSPAAFRTWLADRYWSTVRAGRSDLVAAFPRPAAEDAAEFQVWSRRAAIDDRVPLLVPPLADGRSTVETYAVAPTLRADGLNVVGYFRYESSLGDIARRLAAALAAGDVPAALLGHDRTGSPTIDDAPELAGRVDFATTVAVVNADQFVTLEQDHAEIVRASRRLVGYWFWELERVPRAMRDVLARVDEVWAGSRFVTDAFAAVASIPVRHVPIPVPAPVVSERHRSSFAPLASVGDRFVFGVVLDHFSVTERKNPIGAIRAFRQAFRPDEGPVLVVKTMNAEQRWPQHEGVRAAAEGRPDIVVWDEHLDRADHMAFIRSIDALVSLHRSEGLGLHLAEAMWLGTPTIATRYSGNLDFMADTNSLLVDATLVPVTNGEGVYPNEATWAEPDLDVAAASMRRLASEPELAARLAAAGRATMESQPSLAATGRQIAELLDLERR